LLMQNTYWFYEVVKLNTSLAIDSVVGLAFDENYIDDIDCMEIDDNGNVYLLARVNIPPYNTDVGEFQILRINASNEIVWDKYYTGATRAGIPQGLKTDSDGNLIVLVNNANTSLTYSYASLLKLDTSGTIIEQYDLASNSNLNNSRLAASGLALSSSNRMVMQHTTFTTSSSFVSIANLLPAFGALGTYPYFSGGGDFVYGTNSYTSTNAVTVITTNYMVSTNYTATTSTISVSTINVTTNADVFTIEFDE